MGQTMRETGADPLPESASLIKRLFIGHHGARALWRFLAYAAMVAILAWIAKRLVPVLLGPLDNPPGVDVPVPMIAKELAGFLVVVVPALIMGRLEHRSLADYGLPLRAAFRSDFWTGMLWGLLLLSATVGGIALFHGYSISGLALSGGAIVGYGAVWLVGYLLVGFFEEFAFRGYTLFTVATGIGFWPAAILFSAVFGAAHLGNANEDLIGALVIFLFGIFLCLTLRRTGSLWFAIGAHCTFDWGESYLYSVHNSGATAVGHLVTSTMHGSAWLTGGAVGPEDSVICIVCLALATVLFAWRYPMRR
jgi:uncharacterized protein